MTRDEIHETENARLKQHIVELEAEIRFLGLQSRRHSDQAWIDRTAALESQLQFATVAIDRCRREFLSMKLAIRRGVLPHELCDQAAGSQCFAERALEQIKVKSSNTADGLLGESHTGA